MSDIMSQSIQFDYTSFSFSIVYPLCACCLTSSLVVLGEQKLIFW